MIDLIIPMYNNEDTIERCLGSIIGQTKSRKFFITIVDDGSTYQSFEIIYKFKKNFSLPIRYLPMPTHTGSPGLVRQYGIDNTNCDYIMFLDADDVLSPIAAERAVRVTMQKKPDLVIGAFLGETGDSEEYQYYDTNAITWLHGNIYSRKFLESNKIKFDDRLNEDGSFNLKCFWLAENKMMIKEPMYYWLNNRKSITRGNNNFLLDIADQYVATYTDALSFILANKPDVVTNKKFKECLANKLGEFFQFAEALFVENRPINSIDREMDKFVNLLNKYNYINKEFLMITNRRFNNFNHFPDLVRKANLPYWCKVYKIPYDEVMK